MNNNRYECIGFLELKHISKGIEVLDIIIKKAPIEIVLSTPISGGKYIIAFNGKVQEVEESFNEAKREYNSYIIDSFIIPYIEKSIFERYFNGKVQLNNKEIEALGILETSTCASCILALDTALKTANVNLIKIELGKGIGGKGYFIIEGEVSNIESALLSGIRKIDKKFVLDKVIIPYASKEIFKYL